MGMPVKMPDNTIHAYITCPECGGEIFLGDKDGNLHTILPDGTVYPSVAHYHKDELGCKFHEHIKLKGWGVNKSKNQLNNPIIRCYFTILSFS